MASEATLIGAAPDVYVFRADKQRYFNQPKPQARPQVSSLYKVEPKSFKQGKFSIRKRVISSPKKPVTQVVSQRRQLTPLRRPHPTHQQNKKALPMGSHVKTQVTTPQTLDSHTTKSRLRTQQELPAQSSSNFRPRNTLRPMQSNRHRSENTSKKASPEPRDCFPMAAEACLVKYQEVLTAVERDEIRVVQTVYYLGKRRPKGSGGGAGLLCNFDDEQGDLKVYSKDHIAYRYEILEMIGKGSFGQVFRAYDHKLKQQVALKVIKNRSKYTDQAMIESKLLFQLRMSDPTGHYNIVRIKQCVMFRSHSCLTFQLLYLNLYDFLKLHQFKGFSLQLIHRFAIQILQSLLLLSRHNLIHCDLKPQNIMLRHEHKSGLRVIDLGSSCHENQVMYTYIQSRYYRAPEVILGIDYTKAIDMWSFGCILYELFTGAPVFPGDSEVQQVGLMVQVLGRPPKELMDKVTRKRFFDENAELRNVQDPSGKMYTPFSRSLEQELEQVDKDFIDLIKRCLEWQPSKRITPAEALTHKWILNLLPPDVRHHHLEEMKKQAPQLF